MKICCIGWYDVESIGEETFKTVHRMQLPGHELVFSNRYVESDAVILGGGGVFSENYIKDIPLNIPVFILGVDADPGIINCQPLVQFLKTANVRLFSVRHQCFKEDLDNYFDNVTYCPDLSFALTPPEISKHRTKSAIITVSDTLLPNHDRNNHHFILLAEQAQKALAEGLRPLTEMYWMKYIPFCHAPYLDDVRASMFFSAMLPRHQVEDVILEHLRTMDCLEMFKNCPMSIGMRYHAACFAMMTGTPFVILNPDSNIGMGKFWGLAKDAGLENCCLNLFKMTPNHLLEAHRCASNVPPGKLHKMALERKEVVNKVYEQVRKELA